MRRDEHSDRRRVRQDGMALDPVQLPVDHRLELGQQLFGIARHVDRARSGGQALGDPGRQVVRQVVEGSVVDGQHVATRCSFLTTLYTENEVFPAPEFLRKFCAPKQSLRASGRNRGKTPGDFFELGDS